MIILFSPSEAKNEGGLYPPFDKTSFLFPELFDKRNITLKKYQNFLNTADDEKLSKLSGVKQKNILANIKRIDIFKGGTLKAVQRYSGVGYEYLKYNLLDQNSQNFIENHMIIFSNLFGPVTAKDHIPYYKLKQGEKIDDFSFEKHYRENFSAKLDEFLKERFIVDLRAGFYDKMYKPKTRYLSFKFLKNSKVVSHWAKAYRGILAREIAIKKPVDEKEFLGIEFPNLKIKEIKDIGKKRELIFDIV
jgi:cytoplasmic iron level regulating protein YaaA (DUF328/UPF0246 family)